MPAKEHHLWVKAGEVRETDRQTDKKTKKDRDRERDREIERQRADCFMLLSSSKQEFRNEIRKKGGS